MRMERERRREREARLLGCAVAEQDFGEVQHRREVPRLELERAAKVEQALCVAAEDIVERGALMPRLGIAGRAAQEERQPRLGNVVAFGGDVAGGCVERSGGGAVRMMHPRAPDAVLGLFGFHARAGAQAAEKLRERRQVACGTSLAPPGNQSEDLDLGAGHAQTILMEIAAFRFERPEELAIVHQALRHQMHHLTVALDRAVDAEEPRAEQLAPLALDEARPHDDVYVAVLVLEGDENHAACRIGTLSARDEARGARRGTVRQSLDALGVDQPQAAQAVAQQSKRMPPEREAQAGIVGDDVLPFAWRRQ